MSNTADVLKETGTVYPSRASGITPIFLVSSVLFILLLLCGVVFCFVFYSAFRAESCILTI